jgi:hypothetical protein
MQEINNMVGVQKPEKLVHGVWKVLITDPSLNAFTFGHSSISKYLITDVISPHGHSSILYNTLPTKADEKISIPLNFEGIDVINRSSILIRASKIFFAKWDLTLIDHRSNESFPITSEIEFKVEPFIKSHKLFGFDFTTQRSKKNETPFELKLQLK